MEQILLKDNQGFLSSGFTEEVNRIKFEYREWFNLLEEINSFIYDMYDSIDVRDNDTIGMTIFTAFSKVHKSLQSIIILYSHGLEDDVYILFRTMLESLFISASIKKNKANFDKLLKNQEIEDNQKTNDLIDAGYIKDKCKTKINYRERTSMWDFANEGGFKDIFIAYSYLSPYVHFDLRNLDKNLDRKDNKILTMNVAPSVEDLKFILTELIALILCYIDITLDYSQKDYKIELEGFKKRHSELQKYEKEFIELKFRRGVKNDI
jgi:hypothetical protein